MSVELYFFQPLGSHSGRVYLALLEKGVAFSEHELNGPQFEHLRADYLAINPKGQVPSLVHAGRVLTEGTPICEYIDEAFDGPALRPSDPTERWRMRWWCRFIDSDLGRCLMMIHWNRIVPAFVGNRSVQEVEELLVQVPDPDRQRAWRSAYHQRTPPEELAESQRRVAAAVIRIEATLARQPWLAGAHYSLADIDLINFCGFLPRWSPELVNQRTAPYTLECLARAEERAAVRQLRARSRAPVSAPDAPPG